TSGVRALPPREGRWHEGLLASRGCGPRTAGRPGVCGLPDPQDRPQPGLLPPGHRPEDRRARRAWARSTRQAGFPRDDQPQPGGQPGQPGGGFPGFPGGFPGQPGGGFPGFPGAGGGDPNKGAPVAEKAPQAQAQHAYAYVEIKKAPQKYGTTGNYVIETKFG